MRFLIPKQLAHCAVPAALVLGLIAFSCSKEPAYEGARLLIRPDKADFGTISSNDPVAFHDVTFTLTNPGSERLDIEDIELPEGFEYTILPRRTIRAGGKATLKITMDRRKFSGMVAETAYILSNDSARPRMPIALAASIEGDPTAPPEGGAEGPDIFFDHKTHDFGTVTRDQIIEHSFPFRNIGNDTLKILFIETMCICATAHASRREIRPGESAEIIAKLEAFKYPGIEVRKTLRVSTNDPDEPAVALTIMATVVDVARIEPEQIFLPNLRAGQPASAEARIIQEGPRDLTIREILVSSPMISVDTLPLEGEQEGYLLTITISPEMPEGKFEEVLTIITNYTNFAREKPANGPRLELYKNYRRIKLPIKGTVGGAISVAPRSVNFGSAPPGEPQQRKLIVSGESPFTIESASLADNALRASFASSEIGTRHEIIVEFLPEGSERQIDDKLIIATTNGSLTVPVYATIAPVKKE